MFRLHEIETRDGRSKCINVVIDTPKGSRNKYKYDEVLGLFRLSRVLPVGAQFPYDFGSIPRTCADDGDALDVLVLMEEPTFVGCLVTVRLVGVLRARQRKGSKMIRNDRLIAVAETSVNRPKIHSLDDVGGEELKQIEHFFASYNRAQRRVFVPAGRAGPQAAEVLLAAAVRAFVRCRRP